MLRPQLFSSHTGSGEVHHGLVLDPLSVAENQVARRAGCDVAVAHAHEDIVGHMQAGDETTDFTDDGVVVDVELALGDAVEQFQILKQACSRSPPVAGALVATAVGRIGNEENDPDCEEPCGRFPGGAPDPAPGAGWRPGRWS